jgi:transposase
MQEVYIGIDMASDKFDIAMLKDGNILYKTFTNNELGFKKLKRYFKEHKIKKVIAGVESTGIYQVNLADFLYKNKHTIFILNAYRVKRYGDSHYYNAKTDKIDSEMILNFTIDNFQKGNLYPYKTPSKSQKELKAYVIRRNDLVKAKFKEASKQKTAIRNNLKDIAKSHEKIKKYLEKEILSIEDKIKKLASKDDVLSAKKEALMKIKGVGEVTANTALSIIPELGHVENKKIVSLVGLAPHANDSGKSRKKRHIKKGRVRVKPTLYMSVLVAIRHNDILKEFYERLLSKGKPKKLALTAVMRKLLVAMNTIMIAYNEKMFEENLNDENYEKVT